MPVLMSFNTARRLLAELRAGGPRTHVDLCASDDQVALNAFQLARLIGHCEERDIADVALQYFAVGSHGPGLYAWEQGCPGEGAIRLAVSPLSEAPADAVLTLVAEGRTLPIRFRPCPACGAKVTVVERDAAEVLSDGFEVDDASETLIIKPHSCAGRN